VVDRPGLLNSPGSPVSAANHCKVSVQGWAQNHQHTLETLLGQSLRPVEFSADRLSIILRRSHDVDWPALEAGLWQATCEVYEVPMDCVRVDATTSCGYHTIEPDGVMQLGHSKLYRREWMESAGGAGPAGEPRRWPCVAAAEPLALLDLGGKLPPA
jgi:hypothetical protein